MTLWLSFSVGRSKNNDEATSKIDLVEGTHNPIYFAPRFECRCDYLEAEKGIESTKLLIKDGGGGYPPSPSLTAMPVPNNRL